ncbi:MAG: hypothetical protein HS117_26115 [Verrucomicrobiaceae bacterium]|jgi:hypothetical protein|nr:hypothetical protein [Verrucomicrobiaceae bacterium]
MNQPQREAILDLVILALFADSHLSLKEDNRLQEALDKIGWESLKPREIFFCNSMNRARKAAESEDATTAYIAARAKELSNVWSRTETLSLLESVLASDGVTPVESAFLARVKAALA